MAVNEIGYESGQEKMSALGDLPLLQDIPNQAVWEAWEVTFRDVVILDDMNECYAVFNLTANNLEEAENMQALKMILESAVQGLDSPSPCEP